MLKKFNLKKEAAVINSFARYSEAVLDVFWPRICSSCGMRITEHGRMLLCRTCASAVEPARISCRACGSDSHKTCECHRDLGLRRVYAVTRYEGFAADIVRVIKFKSIKPGLEFRDLMCTDRSPDFSRYDMIFPVPLGPRRRLSRGYNQAQLMLKAAQVEHFPENRQPLVRVRNTKPQTMLDREKRRRNLKNAFALKQGVYVKGKTILIFDDVMTTGQTLKACADVLLSEGALNVDAWVFARAGD